MPCDAPVSMLLAGLNGARHGTIRPSPFLSVPLLRADMPWHCLWPAIEAHQCICGSDAPLVAAIYLAPVTPRRKSEGDMPASLRNDLLKALSEPKPESMATRSTLAS